MQHQLARGARAAKTGEMRCGKTNEADDADGIDDKRAHHQRQQYRGGTNPQR